MPSIGTGFAIKNFSAGFNVGYLFGNRENTTLRSLVNDSLPYYSAEYTTSSSFGHLFLNAGIQYKITFTDTKKTNTYLRLGLSGNWKQTINGSQDKLVQTFTKGSSGEELQVDSVFQNNGVRGEMVYPSSYKAGFVFQKSDKENGSSFFNRRRLHYRKMERIQIFWTGRLGTG